MIGRSLPSGLAGRRPLLLFALGAGLFGLLLGLSWTAESQRRAVADTEQRVLHVDHLVGALDTISIDDAEPPAPPFAAPTLRDDDVVLAAFRGGPVLLVFAHVDGDGAIDDESRRLIVVARTCALELGRAGLDVVVCIPSGPERAAAVVDELGLPREVRVVVDLPPAERRALGLSDELLPTAMLLDKRGRIIAGAPAVLGGAARRSPMPWRPSAGEIADQLGALYEELGSFGGLTEVTERILPGTARLRAMRVGGAYRGLFRAEAADGKLVGWLRAAQPEIGCSECEAPRFIIAVDAAGVVVYVEMVSDLWDGRSVRDFTGQLRGAKQDTPIAMPLTPRAREDAVRRGDQIVDRVVGATRTCEAAVRAVRETLELIDRLARSSVRCAPNGSAEASPQ